MSDDRPAPLVPAFLDLREFSFMPLQVQKLRDSTFATRSTGEEFMAGVLLWSAAWHQVPAGSLANDDAEFAKLAGYGRVIREWKKVKSGALHGFIECSDGRLYHPVTCEQAIDSWNGKIEHAWRKECDRVRKVNKDRAKVGDDPLEMPTKPDPVPMFSIGKSGDEKRNSIGNDKPSVGIPAENALKGQGQGQGQLSKKKEALAPAPVIEPATPSAPAEAVAEAVFDPVEEGRAIGRAFGDAMDAVYGSMAMRSQNATDEFHCAKQLAVDLGLTGAEASAIFDAEMRANAEKGREPIRSIRYFDKRIREAYAKNAEAAAQREASGLPPAPPAVERPYEDHATMQWRSRLEGFRDYGAWSQNHGPRPPGAGQPMPPRAEYPEALAIEIGVSGPAANEAGKAA